MSDTTTPRLRVSREGIVLIKSFEGFRANAVPTDDGRWTIGYGHTASAREGLTVSEEDAELLLQYDLLPVVRALNESVPTGLNQHQFDALASFAISIGVERFLSSDVLQQLSQGRAGQAADALIGWPEAPSPETPLRRRAAERALFNADPAAAMTVADLLLAPLPLRPGAAQSQIPQTQPAPPAALAEIATPEARISDAATPDATVETSPSASMGSAISPFPAADQPVGLTPLTDADMAAAEPPAPSGDTPTAAPADGEPASATERPAPSVLRHEVDEDETRRADWADTGMYVFIGIMGLLACGFASAAFRLAVARPSPLGETAVVGWALALIGVICVSVSAWNLYVRWSRRD